MAEGKVDDAVKETNPSGESQVSTVEKLAEEAAKGIKDFTQKLLHDSSEKKAEAKSQANDMLQPLTFDGKLSDDAKDDIGRKYESKGKIGLEQVHKAGKLEFTNDGSNPAVIPPKDSFTIPSKMTAEDLARQVLGPSASDKQITAYADTVVNLNWDAIDGAQFRAGANVKLPGQAADGSIIYKDRDANGKDVAVKEWNDKSKLVSYNDGSGLASFKDGDSSVTVKWNHNNPRENSEERGKTVVTNPATGDSRYEQRERHSDSQGRTVETQSTDGRPTLVKVTDKNSDVIELTPTANGEFHGKKTNHGREIDGDVWMTKDGRIYSKETDAKGQTVKKFEDGGHATYDAKGRVLENTYKDDKGRTMHEVYKPGKNIAEKISLTDKDGNTLEVKQGKDGLWHGEKKDSSGKVIDKNAGMDTRGNPFSDSKVADGTQRTYENGLVQKLDSKGRLVHEEGKDGLGRQFDATYKPGDNDPDTYKLTVEAGKPPIEFHKQADNSYTADQVDKDGKVIAKVQLRNDGALAYTDPDGSNRRVHFPDGRTAKQTDNPDGTKTQVETKGAEVHTIKLDAQGRKVQETFVGNGRNMTISTEYSGMKKTSEKATIVDDKGFSTLEYNATSDTFTGTRTKYTGETEKVSLINDKLVYRDSKTDQVTGAEQLSKEEGSLVAKATRMDYQMDSGTVSRTLTGGVQMRETLSPGRTEFVNPDGSVSGLRIDGDMSSAGPKGTNEATVMHPNDLTGAHLKPDGTIDVWNKNGTRTEYLSEAEKKFMAKNPDADRRDVAEIHRRLSPDAVKIDEFYKALDKVDDTDNLSKAEKANLKQNLMRHVAYPDEIYQGRSPTCNVAVLQREMAMANPDKYVHFVTNAVGEGSVKTSSGEVHFNVDNLKMGDSSGRDLASRIFQTAAVNMLVYPGKAFLNTESGVGEIRSIADEDKHFWSDKRDFEYKNDSKTFEGLKVFQISEIATKLTGDNYSPVFVGSPEDLAAVYDHNGNRPLTIAVNGSEYPFRKAGPVGEGKGLNHVVTITGVDHGPPLRFYVQNQWGLSQDHSKELTAIDGEDLVMNMKTSGPAAMVLAKVRGGKPRDFNIATVESNGSVTYDRVCTMVDLPDGKTECKE